MNLILWDISLGVEQSEVSKVVDMMMHQVEMAKVEVENVESKAMKNDNILM